MKVRRSLAVLAIGISTVAFPQAHHPTAQASPLLPTSAITNVWTFGIAGSTVYVASDSGLYRSASPTLDQWTRQTTRLDAISAISPNPRQPDSLVYTARVGCCIPDPSLTYNPEDPGTMEFLFGHTYHSVNGGRSETPVRGCDDLLGFVRTRRQPNVMYAFSPEDFCQSRDDGATWTILAVFHRDAYPGTPGYMALAIDPTNDKHLIQGDGQAHSAGATYQSWDGGKTWSELQWSRDGYTLVSALAINPLAPRGAWIAWANEFLTELDLVSTVTRHVTPVSDGLPPTFVTPMDQHFHEPPPVGAIRFDPVTGRVYIIAGGTVYATTQAARHFERFMAPHMGYVAFMEVTPNGYLLTGSQSVPLAVHPLIGTGNWPVSYAFSARADAIAVRLLGQSLSPTTICDGNPCQFFDKGGLEALHGGGYRFVALGSRLIGSRATLPVGASVSSLTYKGLYAAHFQQTPMPAGYHHGTMAVKGGEFIPYSATLTPAPGYVVPSYFWHYITDPNHAPEGWLRDVGLPLTPAITARVRKGPMGWRSITVQAFQYAVLTYDSHNPRPFQVERANIGADYARVFPGAVR